MSAKDPRFWESVRLGGSVGGVGGGVMALFRAVLQGPKLSAPITVAAMVSDGCVMCLPSARLYLMDLVCVCG